MRNPGGSPVTARQAYPPARQIPAGAPLPERNHAVWALGQLGAAAALPVLETLVTGGTCDHDLAVCQHEVEKALALCAGGANPGAVVWRHGDLTGVAAGAAATSEEVFSASSRRRCASTG